MLMYPDHLQNWLDCGHGLLIFLILALFRLSETGQILCFRTFPEECMDAMEGMACNFACLCILSTFRADKIMVMVCSFFSFQRQFHLVKLIQFAVSSSKNTEMLTKENYSAAKKFNYTRRFIDDLHTLNNDGRKQQYGENLPTRIKTEPREPEWWQSNIPWLGRTN